MCLYVCLDVSMNVSTYADYAMLSHDTDGEHNENMYLQLSYHKRIWNAV